MLASAINEAAIANPDQKFAIIDDSTNADLPNVACLMFEQAQASYLVGYAAGLTSEAGNVGFVLGMASPVMHEFGYGFAAGVLDANPEAKLQLSNANSFGDPAQGKSNANAMITGGADVIFHAAGGTGLGVIEACKEANLDYTAVLTQSNALMEVSSGAADACVIDITMANAMTGEGTSYANFTYSIELTSEEYGIACRQGSDLAEAINGIMAELKNDGTLGQLADKYELTLA
jgi:ABC-type sugar transport system substrate-binding protein